MLSPQEDHIQCNFGGVKGRTGNYRGLSTYTVQSEGICMFSDTVSVGTLILTDFSNSRKVKVERFSSTFA
jgi:hypothetical protein